jgi:hypothetical protein
MTRTTHAEIPPRVEYELTPLGEGPPGCGRGYAEDASLCRRRRCRHRCSFVRIPSSRTRAPDRSALPDATSRRRPRVSDLLHVAVMLLMHGECDGGQGVSLDWRVCQESSASRNWLTEGEVVYRSVWVVGTDLCAQAD